MNCIFICVFGNENYIKMFFLLLESIHIYGNLGDDTEILIYTTTSFMKRIKQSHLFNDKMKFEINDAACMGKLDLFDLPQVKNYKKFLCLDTNVIVRDNVNLLFNSIQRDVVYALEEGTIDDETDSWGKSLFGPERECYGDKSAFTSDILLFNKCDAVKNLFATINRDIVNRPGHTYQSYIVNNAFESNLYDNKMLNMFAVSNRNSVLSGKIIHHYPENTESAMTSYLNAIKDRTIMQNINDAKEYINEYLLPIIKNTGEKLEGNIFTLYHTEYTNLFELKAKNISNFVLNKNIKNAMEIGFNSGFSTLLMLLSNSNLKMTCIDIGDHKYTMPCYQKLKETFGDRINLIIGDSTKTLPNMNETYDLIHIDGGHATEIAESDIVNSHRLSKPGSILIMDDYNYQNLHELWDKYIIQYDLRKLDINVYNSPHHDVKIRIV